MRVSLQVTHHLDEVHHRLLVGNPTEAERKLVHTVFAQEIDFGQIKIAFEPLDADMVLWSDRRRRHDYNFERRLRTAAATNGFEIIIEKSYKDIRPQQRQYLHERKQRANIRQHNMRTRDIRLRKVANTLGIFLPVELPEANESWQKISGSLELMKSAVAHSVLVHDAILSQESHGLCAAVTTAPLRPMGLYEYTGQGIETDLATMAKVLSAALQGTASFLAEDGRLNVFFLRHRCGAFLLEIWQTAGGWMMNVTDHMANVSYKKGTRVFVARR